MTQEDQVGGNAVADKRVDFTYNAASHYSANTVGNIGNSVHSSGDWLIEGGAEAAALMSGSSNFVRDGAVLFQTFNPDPRNIMGPRQSEMGSGWRAMALGTDVILVGAGLAAGLSQDAPSIPRPRNRHHTSVEYLAEIKSKGAIDVSRDHCVHVEVGPPFGPRRPDSHTNGHRVGPKAQLGADKEGAYVEFDRTGREIPTHGVSEERLTTRIPADGSLPINNLNPDYWTAPRFWEFWRWFEQ